MTKLEMAYNEGFVAGVRSVTGLAEKAAAAIEQSPGLHVTRSAFAVAALRALAAEARHLCDAIQPLGTSITSDDGAKQK